MAPLLPGAEPFEHAGGPVGVLLCHGFTGSPQTLRGWADYLAARGLTVSLPRLPGHGTTWQDLAQTSGDDWLAEVDAAFGRLASRCEQVFVFGLSMGGCLALTVLRTAFLTTVTREWLPSAVLQAVPLNAVSRYRAEPYRRLPRQDRARPHALVTHN